MTDWLKYFDGEDDDVKAAVVKLGSIQTPSFIDYVRCSDTIGKDKSEGNVEAMLTALVKTFWRNATGGKITDEDFANLSLREGHAISEACSRAFNEASKLVRAVEKKT